MEPDESNEIQQLWDELEKHIRWANALNSQPDIRSRNFSLYVTNLENAQDKLRRHIVEGK